MLSKTQSVALLGTDAKLIDVEVDVSTGGLPCVVTVGLPTASVREATQRIRSAIQSSGLEWPQRRIVANLAPGAVRKEGPHFDLALGLGVLAASGQLELAQLEGWVMMGELALDGSLRSVRGVLAAAIEARGTARRGLICPVSNAPEAALVEGIEIFPAPSLRACVDFLRAGDKAPDVAPIDPLPQEPVPDLIEVRGQRQAKRALEIAAAGGHNVLMRGSPGAGKTMLATRLPGILPPMTQEEALNVTRIYSVAGLLPERASLIVRRPFRVPHHHTSLAGLVGGGSGLARPGELSLAHHGVLFLDELPLYRREVLESLRAPLEEGKIRIARSGGAVTFPCRISLIAAMNPCACGYLTDVKRECSCTSSAIASYRSRLSGPLVDRFDIDIRVYRVGRDQLMGDEPSESSASVRARVERARAMQTERYGSPLLTNASAPRSPVKVASLPAPARSLLAEAIDRVALTGRGLERALRLARTIADLDQRATVIEQDVVEAMGFRIADDAWSEEVPA